jgi:hypothetical protein
VGAALLVAQSRHRDDRSFAPSLLPRRNHGEALAEHNSANALF